MRGERERGKTRKEMRKKEPFFSPFLSSGFLCFPPLQTRAVFSLIHCETPQPGCRSRVSSQLLSLEISPGPATRQYTSPDSKEIILDAASCRCGRGEKRTKDAMLGVSIFRSSHRIHRALRTPPQARCPLKTSAVIVNGTRLITASKNRER